MRETRAMQSAERVRQEQPETQAFVGGQSVAALRFERSRLVARNLDLGAADFIVSQFHYVIEKAAGNAPADVENIDEAVVRARDWFEGRHPLELAIERALGFKRVAVNDLHRAKCARQA